MTGFGKVGHPDYGRLGSSGSVVVLQFDSGRLGHLEKAVQPDSNKPGLPEKVVKADWDRIGPLGKVVRFGSGKLEQSGSEMKV
jgi:hypothetical protein